MRGCVRMLVSWLSDALASMLNPNPQSVPCFSWSFVSQFGHALQNPPSPLRPFAEADRQADLAQRQVAVLDTQRVQNLMREGQWEEAVLLALQLNRKNDVRIILATMLHTLGDAKGPGVHFPPLSCLDHV